MSIYMTITRESLRAWASCYDDERIAELVPSEGLTPRQVSELGIPVADRLWALATMPLPLAQDHARRAAIVREAMRHTADARALAACERVASLCEGVSAGGERDEKLFSEAARAANAAREVAWAEKDAATQAARQAGREAEREAEDAAAWATAREAAMAARAAGAAVAAAASRETARVAAMVAWAEKEAAESRMVAAILAIVDGQAALNDAAA